MKIESMKLKDETSGRTHQATCEQIEKYQFALRVLERGERLIESIRSEIVAEESK